MEQRGVFVFFTSLLFVLRTQEELRLREEDQQTITVEVELKRHDSEPSISVPQPADEARYKKTTQECIKTKTNSAKYIISLFKQNKRYYL